MRTRSSITAIAACLLGALALPVQAAQTDLSSTPFSATTAAQAKPNIMLLMDTSGSMGWGHMPDQIEATIGIGSIGYKAVQCNALYYNPLYPYIPPKQYDGTFFPVPSFISARYDGFDSGSPLVNLSTAFKAYDDNTLRTSGYNDTPQSAYYYVHTGGSPITGYTTPTCADVDSGVSQPASDGGTWTRVTVTTLSTAAQQANFAIWYSYYRTRMNLTKTAVSLAFTPLTDSFRVGFITMFPKVLPVSPAVDPAKYLMIRDFDSTQRMLWFNKLFSQQPGGSSPAREGLARVGRYYAGMQDGINTGMAGPDPVQYYCQQNFTIMTTDGYWNDQAESTGLVGGHIGGGVDKSGKFLVGQQDNPLTLPSGDAPRPIYDGVASGTTITTDNRVLFSRAPCGTYFRQEDYSVSQSTSQARTDTSQTTQTVVQNLQSTSQTLQSNTQVLQDTSQPAQSTFQVLQSTNQNRQNIYQPTQSQTQITEGTQQIVIETNQNLRDTIQILTSTNQTQQDVFEYDLTQTRERESTVQNLSSTVQNLQSTTQTLIGTIQRLQSTFQNLASTVQNLRSTTQITEGTVQNLETTTQYLRSTSQWQRSQTQTTESTAQSFASTFQVNRSTSQLNIQTSRVQRSTSQLRSCDSFTELCTPVPVGSCTPGGTITCETITTGPTYVASCTDDPASVGNNFTATTCNPSGTGPTPTGSCTPDGPTAINGFTTTSCPVLTTGPTPVASCNPAAATVFNAWTAVSCPPVSTGPTAVASCTPQVANGGNFWTDTTCTNNNTGPTGVDTCTSQVANAGNFWFSRNCGSNNTSNVPIGVCTPQTRGAGNSWMEVTCFEATTTNVPVAACATAAAAIGNAWTATSCSTNSNPNVPVASCTPVAASIGNSWTATTCPAPATTGPFGVSSCTPVAAAAGNSWTATVCGNNDNLGVPVASCTASGPNVGNSWITTTCPAPNVTNNVPVLTCTSAAAAIGNAWTTTNCSTNNVLNTPVASCLASGANSGNSWTATTCPAPVTTGPTGVAACTADPATAINTWTETTCTPNNTTGVPVASCAPSGGNGGNSWTTTTCPPANVTTNVPVASCTAAGAALGNSWTTTTCSSNITTDVWVASCTPTAGAIGNGWTTTTCNTEPISGPTRVASCTPVAPIAGNNFVRTTCTGVSTITNVQTCTPSAGPPLVTCNTISTVGVPTASCTPQTPNAGNGWLEILCPPPNVTTNVPVANCVPAGASAGNTWTTTTCPAPITTGPTPTGSCTSAAAAIGNNWTSTTCTTNTTGPFGVASCAPIAAGVGNSWTATVCGNNNTVNVPVVSCAPQTGNVGNNWATITCGNNDQLNVPVATCAPQAGSAGNNWVTINCASSVVTTDVPVSSCTPDPVPFAGNSFTTTTCGNNNVLNVPSGTCVPSGPNLGNSWTTTTCPTLIAGPSGVASCTPQTGNAGNSWLTINCGNANTTNVPVGSCVTVSPNVGNGFLTTACNTLTTTDVPVATCSPTPGASGNSWVTTTCSNGGSSNVPVASCTPQTANPGNNWTEITCPIVLTSTGSASCTPSGPSIGNNYTTTTCPAAVVTGPTPVASCTAQTANAGNAWTTITCGNTVLSSTYVATCTAALPNAGNNWVGTDCFVDSGTKLQYVLTNTVSTQAVSGGVPVGLPIVNTTVSPAADVDGVCQAPPTLVALPSPNPQPAGVTVGSVVVGPAAVENIPGGTDCLGGPPGTWPCTTSVNTSAPESINSLADVAQYYYITDLRKNADWPIDISCDPSEPCPYFRKGVPAVGAGAEDDRRKHQHMTTFSVALGVSGTLQYRPDYKSAPTGDFADIRSGAKDWPLWPDPALDYTNKANWNDPKSIDDFWHAAVNGRGLYFNAKDPRGVVQGLAAALAGIASELAAGSGPGVSTLTPVFGNQAAYLAEYKTQAWEGDVKAYLIDLGTGVIDTSSPLWSAQAKLDTKTGLACDNRNIYVIRTDGTKPANNLASFTWGTSNCDAGMLPSTALPDDLNAAERAHFGVGNVSLLSQYATMTDGTFGFPDQRGAAVDANLVNFLRGQHGMENFDPGTAGKLYRPRPHALGDIVGGQPVYVKAPFASYGDPGYAAFKTAQATRTEMIYVAGNDGMLHAFYADPNPLGANAGQEAWAIIPSPMLPNLYRLADNNYQNNHRFYVDAAPVVSDAKDTGGWKTLLVGGYNSGGKGYYAVDVTDPVAPKALWEFKLDPSACAGSLISPVAAAGQTGDCNLGYSFGQPVITKLTDGRWVVMVTSGYNNVNGAGNGGDGVGFLYVLNAFTGQIIYKFSTGVGDATTPSGLAQINNYVDTVNTDNTALRVYGTDLYGNIWRFDINNNILPAGLQVKLVAVAKDPVGGLPQPITTKPELGEVSGKTMIFVGTGRLLGASDLGNTQVQSIYGIVDNVDGTVSPTHANLRTVLSPLAFTTSGTTRSIACTGTPLQCGAGNGWMVDLPVTGERVNVDPQLALGNLGVASNIPSTTPCDVDGTSWFNELDYKSGLIVPGMSAVSQNYSQGLIVGFVRIKLPSGFMKSQIRFSSGEIITANSSGSTGPSGKRVSWREIVR